VRQVLPTGRLGFLDGFLGECQKFKIFVIIDNHKAHGDFRSMNGRFVQCREVFNIGV
jgi:hypothetical protein